MINKLFTVEIHIKYFLIINIFLRKYWHSNYYFKGNNFMALKWSQFTKLSLISILMLNLLTPSISLGSDGKSNPKKRGPTSELTESKNKRIKVELNADAVRELLSQNEKEDVLDILKNEDIKTSIIKELLAKKDEIGRRIAFSIAKSIYSKTETLGKLNAKIEEILNDHSEHKKADPGDSYFRTKKKEDIDKIVKITIETPGDYSYRSDGKKCEFSVIRKFSVDEVQSLIGHKNLGYDNSNNSYVNHAVVCFGINEVKKEFGKPFWSGLTSLNTAYPKEHS